MAILWSQYPFVNRCIRLPHLAKRGSPMNWCTHPGLFCVHTSKQPSTKVLNNNSSNSLPQSLHRRKNSWCPAIPYEKQPQFPFRFWFHASVWVKGLVCLSAAEDVWGGMPTRDTTVICLESNTGFFIARPITYKFYHVHSHSQHRIAHKQSSHRLINKCNMLHLVPKCR